MAYLRTLFAKFAGLFRKARLEQHLDEDVRAHLDMLTEENLRKGMTPEEARYAAQREFGNIASMKEECRDHWSIRIIEELVQDLRYGLRQLRRNPGFTAVVVLTLALGIGANTAIFSVIYDVLLKPLPYPRPNQLVWVARTQPPFPPDWSLPFSGPNFLDLERDNHTFQNMAAMFGGSFSLTGHGEPENVFGERVTADFFKVLGIQPLLGRGLLSGEDLKGHDLEVVLSHGFWQQKLGGMRDVIGKTVNLNERTYTVVGVMPRGFGYPSRADELWVPLVLPKEDRGSNSYRAIGRLKAGVTLAQAQADMSSIARRLAEEYPESNNREGVMLVPLHEWQGQFIRPTLLILFAAVGFLLLIACANVANLLLARAATRQREMAVRASLGAGRRRLVAQMLVESVLLAMIGGALALLVGQWRIELLRAFRPNNLPELQQIVISLPVLWFTLLVSILTGAIFGLAPAFQVSRVPLNEGLKSSGSGTGRNSEHSRVRNSLVVAQVALSVALLAGAGLMIRSFARYVGVDPGFDPDHLLRFRVIMPEAKFEIATQTRDFYRSALDRIRALPGVESAAISIPLPPGGWETDGGFEVEGHLPAKPSGEGEADAIWHVITPGYFHTMRTQLLKGRIFTPADTEKNLPVVLINETLARRFFPRQDPIGKHLKVAMGDYKQWWQVVGVVSDEAYAGWDDLYSNEIYFPLARLPWPGMYFAVRTKIDPATVAPEMRKAIWSVDKDLPVVEMETMQHALDRAFTPRRFDMTLLLAFALLGVSVAAVGIYGVISYFVSQSTHEIGIRMALGAERRELLRMVVWQGLKLALIGVAIGIAGGLALTRFLSSLLYGVKPTDPLTFIGVSLILIAVALAACYIPARRASKVDPMVALRYE